MFCPKCGKESDDNISYCRYCGENLKQYRSENGRRQKVVKKRKRAGVAVLLIGIIGVILAGCIVICLYFFDQYTGASDTGGKMVSKVGEEDFVATGSFYQCGKYLPLEADENIWGMSKEEFEEYTDITLSNYEEEEIDEVNCLRYDISFLVGSIDGNEFYLDDEESKVVFSEERGVIAVWYKAMPMEQDNSTDFFEKFQKKIVPRIRQREKFNDYYGSDDNTVILVNKMENGVYVCLYSKDFVNSLSKQERIVFEDDFDEPVNTEKPEEGDGTSQTFYEGELDEGYRFSARAAHIEYDQFVPNSSGIWKDTIYELKDGQWVNEGNADKFKVNGVYIADAWVKEDDFTYYYINSAGNKGLNLAYEFDSQCRLINFYPGLTDARDLNYSDVSRDDLYLAIIYSIYKNIFGEEVSWKIIDSRAAKYRFYGGAFDWSTGFVGGVTTDISNSHNDDLDVSVSVNVDCEGKELQDRCAFAVELLSPVADPNTIESAWQMLDLSSNDNQKFVVDGYYGDIEVSAYLKYDDTVIFRLD